MIRTEGLRRMGGYRTYFRSGAEDPEGAALGSERRERLLTAVEGLRDDDRDVLACRYFLELSEQETAAALGIARGTVKSRTHRALSRLQEELR